MQVIIVIKFNINIFFQRFNGNILQKKTSGVNKPLQFCCVAIGSRDRSLSVWSTSLKRPLVVIHELFVSSVLDISWSSCGMCLCACSKDGTIVFIEFTEQELGQPLDSAQQVNIFKNIIFNFSIL
jgi:protein HIRA/HIR1